MEHITMITDVLLRLRSEAMQIPKKCSNEQLRELMKKHNLLFIGEEHNTVYAREIYHTSPERFDNILSLDQWLALIPVACKQLGMKAHPMIEVKKHGTSNPPIAEYSIELF